jgi:hypothetical protein
MDAIRSAIIEVLEQDQPMTVRQVFYRLVSGGWIAKTETEYKQTVGRLLTEMRLEGVIPFGWIADNTRWMQKPTTSSSAEQALRRTSHLYRQALWDNLGVYVEVWREKEALAGVLYDVTNEWDVPLMVTRGYPSLSYVHEAAQAIEAMGKPATILYFGDHDPSVVDIPRNVMDMLREFAPDADIDLDRIAVTPLQLATMGLETRPTKTSDSRSRDFDRDSVEVDAIPPATLRYLYRQAIDDDALDIARAAEEPERTNLTNIIKSMGSAA